LADLVLASASPRRAQILRSLGVSFRVVVSEAEERLEPGEGGAAAAERLARLKAATVGGVEPPPILAADTVVVCDDRILGKPASPDDARQMLRLLAGRTHEVVTGLCLIAPRATLSGVERTEVTFAPMSAEEIDGYVATGEPMDKAGAYHVDGRGALFVSAVAGSPSNVAGLPVRLFLRLVREAGLDVGLPRR
jgi:septum formation protein